MAQNLFSTSLSILIQDLDNPELKNSLEGLSKFLNKKTLKVLVWDEDNIAISFNILVELPPLGNFADIDIRSEEPVLLVCNTKMYPNIPPKVYSDRTDFPKDSLPHLYVAKENKPPAFCLVRGDLGEWYSNKNIKDIVIRTANWLRDAAVGNLVEDGNQFDPLRLEGYRGINIYDYDSLVKTINNQDSFFPNLAKGIFEPITLGNYTFKLKNVITKSNYEKETEIYDNDFKNTSDSPNKKHYHLGYIIWAENDEFYDDYFINFPNNWNDFKLYSEKIRIDYKILEEQIVNDKDVTHYKQIPVIIALKRSKQLIGFSSNIEFINFCLTIDTPDISEDKIADSVKVSLQLHNQPLTVSKAREISGFHANLEGYSLIVGCGALGSKITMHLARSGTKNFVLVDYDIISSHNLVRHALLANAIGVNKAESLKREIRNIYSFENPFIICLNSVENLFNSDISFEYVFDFTASNLFSQNLIKYQIEKQTRVCKAFISNFGSLGILFFEGVDRNPRIDDLKVVLYSKCRNSQFISDWLKLENDENQLNLNVKVGIGCNSETIVLSDDIISLHSSIFSGIIKTHTHKKELSNGQIFLNQICESPFFHNVSYSIEVPPLIVMNTINDSSWQIRILPEVLKSMEFEMNNSKPLETGGVLVGCANFKTKTIHVVESIPAPCDSQNNQVCFIRGIDALKDDIQEIIDLSGNQLGYIGEWHSHPNGPEQLSEVDMKAVNKFKKEFEQLPSPLPVFLMVITPNNILPYVY